MKKLALLIAAGAAFGLVLPLYNLVTTPKNLVELATDASDFVAASTVLQAKCAHCHAAELTSKPIYAAFPIAKGLIAADIAAGEQRFVLSAEQLSGKQPLSEEQLARLEATLYRNTMPPSQYVLMHWRASLSPSDKQALHNLVRAQRSRRPEAAAAAAEFRGEPITPLVAPDDIDQATANLGMRLFHDVRLSGDNTVACASCHSLDKGGTDQAKVSTGIDGQLGPINSPTVFNAGHNVLQFWDGRAKDLQEQAAGPVENPLEMGAKFPEVIEKLKADAEYPELFAGIYGDKGITVKTITHAIAEFERGLITTGSRFDKYLQGDKQALTEDEVAGYRLFVQAGCAGCHYGPAVGGATFERMGMYHDYFSARGDVQEVDAGRYNVTQNEADRHVFKVPMLRNVELTFPYFHDGSRESLQDAVRDMGHYQLDRRLSDDEVAKVVAFLQALTGTYQGRSLSLVKSP